MQRASSFFDSQDEHHQRVRIQAESFEEMESALAAYMEEAPDYSDDINRLRQNIQAALGSLYTEGSTPEPQQYQVIYVTFEYLRQRLGEPKQQKPPEETSEQKKLEAEARGTKEASQQKAVPQMPAASDSDVGDEADRRGCKRKSQ